MKKFKIHYLLYLFIIISPLLDASSCLIGYYFPNISISPTLVIRPLIPLILLGYIFFKDKDKRSKLLLSAIPFIIYGIIHLIITNSLFSGISYGSLMEEASYVINYTYNIYLLYIIYYFYSKGALKDNNKFLFIMLIEYLFIIYFSIITKTSFTTYLEGMGYRSYFLSGNSISTILILLFSSLINRLNVNSFKSKLMNIMVFILLGIYLLFLVGTRTGMLGFVLVSLVYILSSIILYFVKNKKINKKLIIISLVLMIGVGSLVGIVGSETLDRREHIREEGQGIIDVNTNKPGYTTGDTSVIVWQIKNNVVHDGYMSEEEKKTYLELYEYANKNKLDANNNRLQQFIYHTKLVKNQKNLLYLLFGNGRSVHYGEMILEMELVAILLNFGIVGFILYIGPFIALLINILRRLRKDKIDSYIIMNLLGILLGVGLSFIAGYVFFSSTCALIISLMINNLNKEDTI